MNTNCTEFILASSSPRRQELLRSAGKRFRVVVSGFDEGGVVYEGGDAHEYARRLSYLKALAVARECVGSVVLAADTIIEMEGEVMGKPRDEADARGMLGRMSGRWHRVITGYTIMRGAVEVVKSVESRVLFRELSAEEVAEYVGTGEPMDKAGAYAIQGLGANLVERLEGDLSNVVGLPVFEVLKDLREFGV